MFDVPDCGSRGDSDISVGVVILHTMNTPLRSAILAFLYVFVTSVCGTIYLTRQYGDTPHPWDIVLCIGLAIGVGIKDYRASCKMPPLPNGNADVMNQLKSLLDNQKKNDNEKT